MRAAYPTVEVEPSKPSIRFKQWVREFGISRLARSLQVNRSAVHTWVTDAGQTRIPVGTTASRIIALSKIEPLSTGEVLDWCDLLGNPEAVRVEVLQ